MISKFNGTSSSAWLETLSPFAVSLGIRSIAGEPKSVKSIKYGLLIEVRKQAHAENLLKTTTFVEVPVKVTPHRSLKSCRVLSDARNLPVSKKVKFSLNLPHSVCLP